MGVSVVLMDGRVGRGRSLSTVLAAAGCTDPAVVRAMSRVPRESFVAEELREEAYLERSLPIGEGQRIASPSLVARTLQLLSLGPKDKLLEIGTGSGYSAAVAAELARDVYTVERNANLARTASCFLGRLGYHNLHVRHGEGAEGWPEKGPFDAISVTFPAPSLIRPLVQQLTLGGKLVMAMGNTGVGDALLLVTRTAGGFVEDSLQGTRLGPPIAAHALAAGSEKAASYPRSCA